MSAFSKILESKRPTNHEGWIEYAILKAWEVLPESAEFITDNAAEELAALRERVETFEANLRFVINNEKNFTEHDRDGVIRAWVSSLKKILAP